MILDEATAGMDVSGREQVLEILEDFINEGKSIPSGWIISQLCLYEEKIILMAILLTICCS